MFLQESANLGSRPKILCFSNYLVFPLFIGYGCKNPFQYILTHYMVCCSRVRMKELGSPLPKLSNIPSHPSLSIWPSLSPLAMSVTKRMVILSSSELE